ncbi:hypothetical protein MTR_3g453180 [Medicago truncatula]|uniref:Uncharacterized protein n=1 Tax=Medicago truncatula TaxID=3880 RepID=A0A072UVG6_MEDTR|nr:hypothetical protein MTR_3g453180 [Medicago truncatula]
MIHNTFLKGNTNVANSIAEMATTNTSIIALLPCPIRCGILNTPAHDQHYWAWFLDINGGWPDSGNLIAGGPMDFREALIPY